MISARWKKPLIIFVDNENDILKLGADDFAKKPINAGILNTRVKKY
ncbi:MAG: response regulator transcription factor [bacterium]|nr:response regulator transcription factor [bacterium]